MPGISWSYINSVILSFEYLGLIWPVQMGITSKIGTGKDGISPSRPSKARASQGRQDKIQQR